MDSSPSSVCFYSVFTPKSSHCQAASDYNQIAKKKIKLAACVKGGWSQNSGRQTTGVFFLFFVFLISAASCFTGSFVGFFLFFFTYDWNFRINKQSISSLQTEDTQMDRCKNPSNFFEKADFVSRLCSRSPRSLIYRLQTNVSGGRQQLGWHLCSTSSCFLGGVFVLISEWSYTPAPVSLTGTLEEKKKTKLTLTQIFRNTKALVCITCLAAKYWCGLKDIRPAHQSLPTLPTAPLKANKLASGQRKAQIKAVRNCCEPNSAQTIKRRNDA